MVYEFAGLGEILVCTIGLLLMAFEEALEALEVMPVSTEAADIRVEAVAVDKEFAFALLLFGSWWLSISASCSRCSCSNSSFFMCFMERFLSLGMTSAAPACNFVECLSRRSLLLNFREQMLQVKGFSFVWERSCLFKCSWRAKARVQVAQTNSLGFPDGVEPFSVNSWLTGPLEDILLVDKYLETPSSAVMVVTGSSPLLVCSSSLYGGPLPVSSVCRRSSFCTAGARMFSVRLWVEGRKCGWTGTAWKREGWLPSFFASADCNWLPLLSLLISRWCWVRLDCCAIPEVHVQTHPREEEHTEWTKIKNKGRCLFSTR